MEFNDFVRIPFPIQAVQITEENMEELCSLVGHSVDEEDGVRYIRLNRKIVPVGAKAFAGTWVTKMGKQIRCYPDAVFSKQFTERTSEWEGWLEVVSDPASDVSETESESPFLDSIKNDIPGPEVIPEIPDDQVTPPENKPQVGDTFTQDVVEPYNQ